MTVGLAGTNLANKWLDLLRGVAFTAPAATYVQLHTADPGAAGTTALSTGVTGRQAATFSAASSGAIALTGTNPAFTATGSDTITHISVWSASTAGTFLWSAALTTPKSVVATDTITFTTIGVSLTPLAA